MTLNAEPRAVATGSVRADLLNRSLQVGYCRKDPVATARGSEFECYGKGRGRYRSRFCIEC